MTTSQIPAADAAPGVDAEALGRHIAEMYRAVANRAQRTSDNYGADTIELLAVKPTQESSR
jgi:hypothetical protein